LGNALAGFEDKRSTESKKEPKIAAGAEANSRRNGI